MKASRLPCSRVRKTPQAVNPHRLVLCRLFAAVQTWAELSRLLQVIGVIEHLHRGEIIMGRGILLWLLGVPIPIIILIMLFMR